MKYIFYENTEEGIATPIIFPEFLNHDDVAEKINPNGIIISAGFCKVVDNKFIAYGRSQTLNIESREKDTALLNLIADLK